MNRVMNMSAVTVSTPYRGFRCPGSFGRRQRNRFRGFPGWRPFQPSRRGGSNPRLAAGFSNAEFRDGDGSEGLFYGTFVAQSEQFAASGTDG